jgi:hypothetical protein
MSVGKGIVIKGVERYLWVVPEEDRLVLAIPRLRGLKLSVHEARTTGKMLIQAVDELAGHQNNLVEDGDNCGSAQEHSIEG